MIPFNFEYYKPDSMVEAVEAFKLLDSMGKQPHYYNGGTEIITFARVNSLYTGGIIDIKGIPECNVLEIKDEYLVIGSSVTLSEISDSRLYPLLGSVSREIADRTARNKITLGGNICGNIQFKEAVLPLLISDSYFVTAGGRGIKTYPIKDIFDGSPRLEDGEFIVQILVPRGNIHLPYINIKRRRASPIGYPLVSIAAARKGREIRTAISGVCDFTLRDSNMENEINRYELPVEIRVENAIEALSRKIKNDVFSSAEFRRYLLKNALVTIINELEAMNEEI